MKHLKISSQKHKIDSLLVSSRCMTNYKKVVYFYTLISLNKWKWLRICLKESLWWKTHLWKTYAVGTHCNCLIRRTYTCTIFLKNHDDQEMTQGRRQTLSDYCNSIKQIMLKESRKKHVIQGGNNMARDILWSLLEISFVTLRINRKLKKNIDKMCNTFYSFVVYYSQFIWFQFSMAMDNLQKNKTKV